MLWAGELKPKVLEREGVEELDYNYLNVTAIKAL